MKNVLILCVLFAFAISGKAQTWEYHNSYATVNDIVIDTQGNKWLATEGGGLFKYDGVGFKNYTIANGLLPAGFNQINTLKIDNQNNIWIGGRGGISKFDGAAFTNYITANGSILNSIYVPNMAVDNNNDLWIGTCCFGALKFDGITFTSYNTTNGLPDNKTRIFIDRQNDVWFLTEAGLCVLRNGSTAIETVANPQPQLNLYPNPTTNTLHFPELEGKTHVEIYDIQGRLQFSQLLLQNNICAGVYIIKTKNDKGNFVNKIVKE